jgi:hypothetical protein
MLAGKQIRLEELEIAYSLAVAPDRHLFVLGTAWSLLERLAMRQISLCRLPHDARALRQSSSRWSVPCLPSRADPENRDS